MRRDQRNRAAARAYLEGFERRFVATRDGVIYLPGETGAGIRVPPREAASIIAGMRATLQEAESRHPLWTQDAVFLAGFVFCVVVMAGAVSGFGRLAMASIGPLVVAILLLGPALGHIRVWLAWRRGLEEATRRLQCFEPLAAEQTRRSVRPNPVRPVFVVVATLAAAIIVGLTVATTTAPRHGAVAVDRFLAGTVGWAAAILILLALLYKVVDAFVRPRLSEGAIERALVEREYLPLVSDESAWRTPEPLVAPPPPERPSRRDYPPVSYGRKRR